MAVKKIYRYLLAAVLLFFAAVCITEIFFRSVELDYCKNIIPYRKGVAAIQEGDVFDTILYADTDGKLLEQIKIPYTNYIKGEIRNYIMLMTDEKGNLYSFTSVYHSNGNISWEVSLCRFDVGILQKKWQIEAPDGFEYTDIDGIIPMVENGNLYIPWTDKATGDYGFYTYDASGIERRMEKDELFDQDEAQESYYAAVEVLRENYPDEFSHFQYLANVDDEKSALGYEKDGDLIGLYIENGNRHYYEKVTGNWQFGMVIRIWLVLIVCALIVWGIRLLLGLRSSKNLLRKREVKFVSLTSTISMVSALVTVVLMAAISNGIYNDVKLRYEFWITADCQYAVKYVISRLQSDANIIIEDDKPEISIELVDDSIESFHNLMEQKDKNENYDFVILAEWNDELYSVYSEDYKGSYKAVNVISQISVKRFGEAIESNRYQRFDDKWYIGLIKYTAIPFQLYTSDTAENVNVVVGVSSDAYTEAVYYLSVMPKILLIMVLLGVALWIIINCILGFFLVRIKRLGNDLKMYGETGDSQCFKLEGVDEIGQTAHTFRVMAGGIEVHRKDIMDSNSNYRKLLPTGIMRLMGKERITQVSVGEYCEVEALVLLFTFRDKEAITREEQIYEVMKFADKYKGVVTHFNRDELYMAVSIKWDIDEMMQKFAAEIGTGLGIEMQAASGSFDVGSSGSEQNAYLTATGAVFRQLLTLENREKGEVNG